MKRPTQTHISNKPTNKNGLWLLLMVVVIGLHIFLFLVYFVRKSENEDITTTSHQAKSTLTNNSSKESEKVHASPATLGSMTVLHDGHTHNISKDTIKHSAENNHQTISSAMPSMIATNDDGIEHRTTINTTSKKLSDNKNNNSHQNEQAIPTTNNTSSNKQSMQDKQKPITTPKKDEHDNRANTHHNSKEKETDKIAKKDSKNLSDSEHTPDSEHTNVQKEANQKYKTEHPPHYQGIDVQNKQYRPETTEQIITEQMIKDTQLLSVDLPKSQQQKLVTNNPRIKKLQKKVNHLKKNTETVQKQLSNSIQSVKEINQRKIEKERQLAKRAYQDSLKIKQLKKQRQQKPKTQKINKKIKEVNLNDKTVISVADKTAMNKRTTNTVITNTVIKESKQTLKIAENKEKNENN